MSPPTAPVVPPEPAGPGPGGRAFWWPLLAVLVSVAVYLPALANDFTYDDRHVAMGQDGARTNPMVAELQPLGEYFGSHYWRGSAEQSRLYRPVTVLSFALRHYWCGDNAVVAHAINLVLHGLATLLVYWLLRGLRAQPPLAALGALCFGVHAIHSEVVANVAGRAELLAFCGGATALLLLCWAREQLGAARILGWGAAALALFMALGGKESALAWVPFAACYGLARWCSNRHRRWWLSPIALAEAAALSLPVIVYLWLRTAALDFDLPADAAWAPDHIHNPLFDTEPLVRILGACAVWAFGLLTTLLPLWLSADWGTAVLPLPDSLRDPSLALGLLGGAVLALVGWIGVAQAMRRPGLLAAAACFLGFGFMTSNLALPIGTLYAERLYYAPSAAVAFVVVALAPAARPGGAPRALWPVMLLGAWLGANALILTQRTRVFRDNETLILHEALHQPRSVQMRFQAGLLLAQRGEVVHAIEHLSAAVYHDPGHVAARAALGDLQAEIGDEDAAVMSWSAALHGRQRERDAHEPQLRARLAQAYAGRGHYREALSELAASFLAAPAWCRQQPHLAALAAEIAKSDELPPPLLREAERLATDLAPSQPPR